MAVFSPNVIFDPTTVAVFLGVLILCWIFYPRKKYNLPPGPYSWPIIGSTVELMRSKHGNKQYFQYMDWAEKYGSVFYVKTLLGNMVVVNRIKDVMEALVTKSTETAGRMHFYTVDKFSDGGKDIVFNDYSEMVKYMRRISGAALRNLLSGGKLETMAHDSVTKGMQMFDDKARAKEAFDPFPLLSIMVYNIICAMCFDTKYELEDEEFQTLFSSSKDVNEAFSTGVFLVDVFPPARYLPPTPAFKRFLQILDNYDEIVMKHIKEHKKNYDPNNVKDLIDHMIKIEQESEAESNNVKKVTLDEQHYKQIILDIFGAGTDTTSMTLLFIMYLLARHPEVQEKVQEEIDRVVDPDRLPDCSDKPNMPYCEAVMYECMRFGTIAPLGVPHKTMCDVELGGYEIPKDTIVMINHFALHRDTKEWVNPEEFIPDRFLDEDGQLLLKPRSFLPFGAGKRVCLGEAIAKPEIFMIYTALFQKFSFKSEGGCSKEMKFQDATFYFLPEPFKVVAELRN